MLKAAGTKWNFLNFKPGLVGGHCIGVDPYYLKFKALEEGFKPKLISSGRSINDFMPKFIFGQIKKIMTNAPEGMDSVMIGVDKSGCSGYSYKLDFANSADFKNFEVITQEGAKVLIDPKATMFLLGSVMDYKTDKLSFYLYQKYKYKLKQLQLLQNYLLGLNL